MDNQVTDKAVRCLIALVHSRYSSACGVAYAVAEGSRPAAQCGTGHGTGQQKTSAGLLTALHVLCVHLSALQRLEECKILLNVHIAPASRGIARIVAQP